MGNLLIYAILASMKVHFILVFHAILIAILGVLLVSSPFIATRYPHFFSNPLTLIFFVLVLTTNGISAYKKDKCILTSWEQKYMERPYIDSCIKNYAKTWLDLKLSENLISIVILLFLAIPVAVGLLGLF
jgi:hypothetical protein